MRYSDYKERIKLLRVNGYEKIVGIGVYRKWFRYGSYHSVQAITCTDLQFPGDFHQMLSFLYEKNMFCLNEERIKRLVH